MWLGFWKALPDIVDEGRSGEKAQAIYARTEHRGFGSDRFKNEIEIKLQGRVRPSP